MASYLITGCSRGLGLALAERLLSFPVSEVRTVIATSRTESTALNDLATKSKERIILIQLDTTSESSIKDAVTKAVKALGEKGLDVLINNAGTCTYIQGGISAMDNLGDHFTTNVTSVHLMTRAFLPLLQKGTQKKVVNMSTTLGSLAKATKFDATKWPVDCPAYKISKTALNMLTVQYSLNYADQGFIFIALTPGWLRTNLGGESADLSVEEGAEASVERIMAAEKEDNGKFVNIHIKGWENNEGLNQYDGNELPW